MAREPETSRADEHVDDAASAAVEVDVARTGGFAGMTRRWSAQPPADEASEWITLIDRCPWEQAAPRQPAGGQLPSTSHDQPSTSSRGADRFVWWIRASWPTPIPGAHDGGQEATEHREAERREAELPDDELTGAWRELVEAVRSWGDEERDRPGR